ncbi:unnamed protein product, partial [Vitis vinifera]
MPHRVYPGITKKVNSATPRNIFKSESPEVKLTVVIVSNYECPWLSNLLIPVECNLECRLAGG